MRSQWFRTGSLAGCLIVASGCSSAAQDRADEGGDAPAQQAAAPASTPSVPKADAAAHEPIVRRAREALKAANVAGADSATVLSVEPHQWNDSSLGCPAQGQMYMQVITDGHIVRFDAGGTPMAVNVAGENAVICNQMSMSDRPAKRTNVPVRAVTFQKAVDAARKDLATKLGVPVEEIKVVGSVPFIWTDGTFRCGAASDARPEVRGYKLQLARGQDAFYYHTDFEATFPCPPVEAQ